MSSWLLKPHARLDSLEIEWFKCVGSLGSFDRMCYSVHAHLMFAVGLDTSAERILMHLKELTASLNDLHSRIVKWDTGWSRRRVCSIGRLASFVGFASNHARRVQSLPGARGHANCPRTFVYLSFFGVGCNQNRITTPLSKLRLILG